MKYAIAFHTDAGIKKETNQDSLVIKKAKTTNGMIAFASVCDGMGGLDKGEVASASVVQSFSDWFEHELPYALSSVDKITQIKQQWRTMILEQNQKIIAYGNDAHMQMGTTCTAILLFEDGTYLIAHVGDSRIYRIKQTEIEILTEDHTLVAKDIKTGRITKEQAEYDPRRNVLLQCIGVADHVEPDFLEGKADKDECYMLCSDGFRHLISEEEIQSYLSPYKNENEQIMKESIIQLIELNMQRNETDNITSILIKTS